MDMRPSLILAILLVTLTAPAAHAAQDASLFRSLQEKGSAPGTSQRQGQAPATGFVERMRQKGIAPLPTASRPARTETPETAVRQPDKKTRQTPRPPAGSPRNPGPQRPETKAAADPSATFSGRVQSDGQGGYRMFDTMGRPTKTLTPDGRGGFRIYDASGRFLGRVTSK